MGELTKNEHFVKFPYRAGRRDNGDINNGGIDLTKQLERIVEIHELEGAEWLRGFVESVNRPGNLFMTFGCVWGQEEGKFINGFVDFSLRPESPKQLRGNFLELDEQFFAYHLEAMIAAKVDNPKAVNDTARHCLVWEFTPLEIYGESYQKVTLIFQAPSHKAAEWLFDHLSFFLNGYYQSCIKYDT